MFSIMRYKVEEGRSHSEEYDVFECDRARADNLCTALRSMRDGYWYWPEECPSTTTPDNSYELHESEIRTAVTALLVG